MTDPNPADVQSSKLRLPVRGALVAGNNATHGH
jgi:hypothetical protein